MELKDLLEAPVNTLTTEQLELRLSLQKKLKIRFGGKPKVEGTKVKVNMKSAKAPKSNMDKQMEDLLKHMSKEDLAKLAATLNGSNGGQ